MSNNLSIGIIGMGSFGTYIAGLLPKGVNALGNSRRSSIPSNLTKASLKQVCQSDIVILAIALDAYDVVLPKVSKYIAKNSLVIDVCSVKTLPEKLFAKYLPNHDNIMLTHPLFGPQSAKDSTKGHQLIITKAKGRLISEVEAYCKQVLELKVSHMTAQEHDKIMAQIHVLTFFVARGLGSMRLSDSPFMTPSYKMITDLVEFDHSHSQELFETIQSGNPYASKIQKELITSFEKIYQDLN